MSNGFETRNNETEEVLLPDPERVIEGLRDTGYSFNTAIADIVDNSIAAEATKVDIGVEVNPAGELIVTIADNGTGMDGDDLRNAMRYGSRKREDPSSLGKFGLGLKTGSTAFCRCLSVVSRSSHDSIVRKVQWDLDYIAENKEWVLKRPEPNEEEILLLDETAQGGTGTLVVWEKIDRLLTKGKTIANKRAALKKVVEKLRFHLSLVFQRFLDKNNAEVKNVEITINRADISSWDPFCIAEKDTMAVARDTFEVEMFDGKTARFKLAAYLLPRRENFSTPQAREMAKLSNDMQGFYVYRENRLIHYGDWLGMFSSEPHYSLLRVEFSFDYKLDEVFKVDIKKSRILLSEEIFEYIRETFLPAPRRAAEERYRKGTAKVVAVKGSDAHDASNKNIEEKASSIESAQITVTDADHVTIQNKNGQFEHKITIRSAAKQGQYRVIPVPSIDDGMLWNPCIVDGKHAVEINQSHPYYQKIYYPILAQNVMVTGMDALLWALSEAELATFNEDTKEQYEDMRVLVSRCLKKLIADLPDPEPEDSED